MNHEKFGEEVMNHESKKVSELSEIEKNTVEEVEGWAEERFKVISDPVHGWDHVQRVTKNAVTICRGEGGDEFLTRISALMHDLGRINESKGDHRYPHALLSIFEGSEKNRDLYQRGLLDLEQWRKISSAVAGHSKLLKAEDRTKLLDILQDADRLDAFGFNGMFRNISEDKKFNLPVYKEGEPLDYPEGYMMKPKEIVSAYSHLFFVISFKDILSNETAKEMAEPGVMIVKDFINLIRNRIQKNEIEGYDFWLDFIDYAKKQRLERATEEDVKNFIEEREKRQV